MSLVGLKNGNGTQVLVTKAVYRALEKMPYRSQDNKKLDAKVIARYFLASMTAYVLEADNLEEGIVFGLIDCGNYGFEYGAISLYELAGVAIPVTINGHRFEHIKVAIERDINVKPLKKTLGQCIEIYVERDRMPSFLFEEDEEAI